MFGLREGEVDIALWVKRSRKGAGLLLVISLYVVV